MPVVVLFVFGLVLRLWFHAATPDGGTCWHIGFQGDAPIWEDLAGRIAQGLPDVEIRLPWRPPGMMRMVAFLWDGEGATAAPVRLLFTALGAAIAPLFWLLIRGHVAAPVAWLAAVLTAAASNLLLLSSGLHVETPYLVLLLLALLAQQRFAGRRALVAAIVWGLLHAAMCLLRAEHVLLAAVLAALARAGGASWRTLAIAVLATAAPLIPWQLHVGRAVAEFNAGAPPLPATQTRWEDDALTALRAMPAFQQESVFRFVTATMRTRGRDTVRAADLEVVREAYGVFPAPLRPAFVAVQGGFSFWLANTPEADGGHTRRCLDRPPPLTGGEHLYPPGTATARPRGGAFSFAYPPHADVFVNGYRRGLEEIAADPLGALRRCGKKLLYTIEGATGGVGGYALPIGLSGVRPSVDLVIATGIWPGVWRGLVLGAAMFGWWRLRRTRASWPLLATAATRALLILAFFGHARHGALLLPVVALGVAEALHAITAVRWPRACSWLATALLVALTALEIVRTNTTRVDIDGRPWIRAAGGTAEYEPHVITFH